LIIGGAMRWLPLALLLIGCGGPLCDADGLAGALESAGTGEVVEVGACRIAGDFTVPAGVTLRGEPGSVIEGRIDLSSGSIENLAVESTGAGIVAQDGGAASIRDVEVTASTGIGIAANGVGSLEMERITIRGPVSAGNIMSLRGMVPDNLTTATHGLIIENVPDAMLADVSTRGFARFGALLKSSTTSWSGGDANDNAWVGIMVEYGSAVISDVEVNDTLDLALDHGATFGVVTGTAAIETARVSVRGSEGFGLFHLNGTVAHEDLTSSENSSGGVWLEIVDSAEISGELAMNDFGAIFAVLSENVVIRDTVVRNSAEAMRNGVQSGDGIQLVDSHRGARIENTMVLGNDRAGIVIDLFGDNLAAGLFGNVSVMRDSTEENGVLVQGGTRAADWDDGLIRDAATTQADDAVTGNVQIVGAVGPCFFPES
jgi:hypothetical protein